MTPSDSPSALLERAAAKLERLAEDAPQAPWRLAGDGDLLGYGPVPIVYSEYSEYGEYGDVEVQWAPGMSDWLIAMSPSVAQPLVEWLQHEAAGAERGYFDPAPHAVAFAKLVLGES